MSSSVDEFGYVDQLWSSDTSAVVWGRLRSARKNVKAVNELVEAKCALDKKYAKDLRKIAANCVIGADDPSVGLVCRGIVGAYDQYASSIEKQSAFVETQVVQRFQKLIVLLKNERLMMENKFGNAVKHLETCQKNAEKSRKNLLKVNEVAEIMRRSDAHGEFKLQNTITAMKMKGGNIDVEYRKVIDEQNLAEMNLLNAKALLETNIIQILERLESIDIQRLREFQEIVSKICESEASQTEIRIDLSQNVTSCAQKLNIKKDIEDFLNSHSAKSPCPWRVKDEKNLKVALDVLSPKIDTNLKGSENFEAKATNLLATNSVTTSQSAVTPASSPQNVESQSSPSRINSQLSLDKLGIELSLLASKVSEISYDCCRIYVFKNLKWPRELALLDENQIAFDNLIFYLQFNSEIKRKDEDSLDVIRDVFRVHAEISLDEFNSMNEVIQSTFKSFFNIKSMKLNSYSFRINFIRALIYSKLNDSSDGIKKSSLTFLSPNERKILERNCILVMSSLLSVTEEAEVCSRIIDTCTYFYKQIVKLGLEKKASVDQKFIEKAFEKSFRELDHLIISICGETGELSMKFLENVLERLLGALIDSSGDEDDSSIHLNSSYVEILELCEKYAKDVKITSNTYHLMVSLIALKLLKANDWDEASAAFDIFVKSIHQISQGVGDDLKSYQSNMLKIQSIIEFRLLEYFQLDPKRALSLFQGFIFLNSIIIQDEAKSFEKLETLLILSCQKRYVKWKSKYCFVKIESQETDISLWSKFCEIVQEGVSSDFKTFLNLFDQKIVFSKKHVSYSFQIQILKTFFDWLWLDFRLLLSILDKDEKSFSKKISVFVFFKKFFEFALKCANPLKDSKSFFSSELRSMNRIAENSFLSWIEEKKSKIAQMIQRAVDIETWEPISSNIKFAHSVNDLFSLIYTLISSFFKLASELSPFVIWKGLPDTNSEFDGIYNFLKFIDESARAYVDSISKGCFVKRVDEIDFEAEMNPESEEKENSVSKLKHALKMKIKNVRNGSKRIAKLEVPAMDSKTLCTRLNSIQQVWLNIKGIRENIFQEAEKIIKVSKSELDFIIKCFKFEPSPMECWKIFDATEIYIHDLYPKIAAIISDKLVKTKLSVLHKKLYLPSIQGYFLRKSSFQFEIRDTFAFCVDNLESDLLEYMETELLKSICLVIQLILSDESFARSYCPIDCNVLLADITKIQEDFSNLLDSKQIAQITFSLSSYITDMSRTSEELIQMFQKNQIDKPRIKQLFSTRKNDAVASKFLATHFH